MLSALRASASSTVGSRSYKAINTTYRRFLSDTKKGLPASDRTLQKYANRRRDGMILASFVVIGWPVSYYLTE